MNVLIYYYINIFFIDTINIIVYYTVKLQLLYYLLEQEAKYSDVVPNKNIVDVPKGEKTNKKSSPIPGRYTCTIYLL